MCSRGAWVERGDHNALRPEVIPQSPRASNKQACYFDSAARRGAGSGQNLSSGCHLGRGLGGPLLRWSERPNHDQSSKSHECHDDFHNHISAKLSSYQSARTCVSGNSAQKNASVRKAIIPASTSRPKLTSSVWARWGFIASLADHLPDRFQCIERTDYLLLSKRIKTIARNLCAPYMES